MKNFFNKNWHKLILITYGYIVPAVSFAVCPDGSSSDGKICNPLGKTDTVPGFIQTILEGMLKIGIPIIALAVVYCGFLFVFARGNTEKVTKAKEALTYTLIGAAILLGSWAIAEMISATVTSLST